MLICIGKDTVTLTYLLIYLQILINQYTRMICIYNDLLKGYHIMETLKKTGNGKLIYSHNIVLMTYYYVIVKYLSSLTLFNMSIPRKQ